MREDILRIGNAEYQHEYQPDTAQGVEGCTPDLLLGLGALPTVLYKGHTALGFVAGIDKALRVEFYSNAFVSILLPCSIDICRILVVFICLKEEYTVVAPCNDVVFEHLSSVFINCLWILHKHLVALNILNIGTKRSESVSICIPIKNAVLSAIIKFLYDAQGSVQSVR